MQSIVGVQCVHGLMNNAMQIEQVATTSPITLETFHTRKMFAMQFNAPNQKLSLVKLDIPVPLTNEILLKVNACGICRTDLHIIDGELTHPSLPIIPGHQIVGKIVALGTNVKNFHLNQRVGVPWLGYTCGCCRYCLDGQENLCDTAKYTGYNINGGFAEYCVANANYCFAIPDQYSDIQAAPLLCAGLIGYRSFKKLPELTKHIGIFGFGAAAHIITQVAKYLGKEIYAFTKDGDISAQDLALKLGAVWAGGISETAPHELDGALIYAPIGDLVPLALKKLRKGGTVVCAGIHMSDIPSFPYAILWGERSICSVANLTKKDGNEFMQLVQRVNIKTEVHTYPLDNANQALDDLRHGRFTGAGVITINNSGWKMTYQLLKNRSHAGKMLAKKLIQYKNALDTIVLALPRGGVPVAYQIAMELNLPLDMRL